MGKIIFIIIGLLILLTINKKKKGFLCPSSFLILIYLSAAVFCVLHIIINNETRIYLDKYWAAAIVFLIIITGYLFPFIRINETKWERLILPPMSFLNIFSTALIILSFYAIFFYISDVVRIFTSGDLAAMREVMNGNQGEYTNSGFWNTVASVSASFYNIALLLFFIYCAIDDGNRMRKVLLLISSFSYTIQCLTYVGRDGVVFWFFSVALYYLLLHQYIPGRIINHLKKRFFIIVVILLTPFMAITVSRFGDSESGTGGGMISYMGQSIYHWCMYYGMEHPIHNPGAGWPLFYEITGKTQPAGYGMWEGEGTFSWSFGTFIRSFDDSLGMTGVILIMFFMWIVFFSVFRNHKAISFRQLFIYILFFDIISQGVFYFKYYTRGGNLTIVLMFLFYFFFRFSNQRTISLTQKD